jgi:6-phosphofructokinase 1
MKQEEAEHDLMIALKSQPGLHGAGWEYLFDSANRLIEGRLDELAGVASHVHPRRDYYKNVARRVGLTEDEVFVSDEANVAACEDSRIEAAFRAQGLAGKLPCFRVLADREMYRLNPAKLRVGIVTQGGNAAGYNVIIDSIVKRHAYLSTPAEAGAPTNPDGTSIGLELFGFEDGFAGLGRHAPTPLRVRETDKTALKPGSILRLYIDGSRAVDEQACWQTVARHELDVLYVVGDRNAMSMADRGCEVLENQVGRAKERIRIVGAPVSVEDDFAFTDASVGFHTALVNAVEFIQKVHSEAEACRQLAVVVLPGERSGSLSLHASYASGEVDYALIPEMLATTEAAREEELQRAIHLLIRRYHNNRHAVVVLSDMSTLGPSKAKGSGEQEASTTDRFIETLQAGLVREPRGPDGLTGRVVIRTAHTLGSGSPFPYDVDLGKLTGKLMVEAALSGLSRCIVCQWKGKFVVVPMRLAVGRAKTVDLQSYGPRTMSEKYLLTPVPRTTAAGEPAVNFEFELLG